jgi:hypothetical protein
LTVSGYKEAEDFDFRVDNKLALIYVASTSFECFNCTFKDVKEVVLDISKTLDSSPSDIFECKFKNCQQTTPLVGTIKNCEFSNMSAVVFGDCVEFDNKIVSVTDSLFNQIDGRIIVEYGKIEHCTFSDSTLTLEVKGKPTGKDAFHSEANDLTFINCIALEKKSIFTYLDSPCFLQATSYLDKAGICVLFNGCKFENCQTKGNYININKKIYGTLNRIKTIILGRECGTSIN